MTKALRFARGQHWLLDAYIHMNIRISNFYNLQDGGHDLQFQPPVC